LGWYSAVLGFVSILCTSSSAKPLLLQEMASRPAFKWTSS